LERVRAIVDGLGLPEKDRKYRPVETERNKCCFDIQGIRFTLGFSALEEKIEEWPVYD
jgi:hypothetical protein